MYLAGYQAGPVYPVAPMPFDSQLVTTRIVAADHAGVVCLNEAVRSSRVARSLVGYAAIGLAPVEVLLMIALAVAGRRPAAAARMLGAVALVYLASEALGTLWPRQRPFARLARVEALVPHVQQRSFPSRHVAAGLAMAIIGRRTHAHLGLSMALVAAMLGVSRVAAGLHYPSDVLAGGTVGVAIGRWLGR
jgi:undecaprenyl-diphosphatase